MLVSFKVWQHPLTTFLGQLNDPFIMMWMLRWWPYAVSHHLNPLFCSFLWWPQGVHLLSTTNIMLYAVLFSSVTKALGAMFSYNVLLLMNTTLSAWSIYCLAFYCCRARISAFLAGIFFVLSAFQMAHIYAGHVNLTASYFPVFILFFSIKFYREELRFFSFIVMASVLFLGLFFVSKEMWLLTWMVFFLLIALVYVMLADFLLPKRVFSAIIAIFTINFVVVFPFVIAFSSSYPLYYHTPVDFSSDFVNFFLPSSLQAIGGNFLSSHGVVLASTITEQTAYLGFPLCVMVFLLWQAVRDAYQKLALVFIGLVMLLSLGPALNVLSYRLFYFPWASLYVLPGFAFIQPARFMCFADIAFSLLLARFLTCAEWSLYFRAALCGFVFLTYCPNLTLPWIHQDTRGFLRMPPDVASWVKGDMRILVLSERSSLLSEMMLWRLNEGRHFKLMSAHLGPGAIPNPSGIAFVLPKSYTMSSKAFHDYLASYKPDLVMVSSAEALLYAHFTKTLGVPKKVNQHIIVYKIQR